MIDIKLVGNITARTLDQDDNINAVANQTLEHSIRLR